MFSLTQQVPAHMREGGDEDENDGGEGQGDISRIQLPDDGNIEVDDSERGILPCRFYDIQGRNASVIQYGFR